MAHAFKHVPQASTSKTLNAYNAKAASNAQAHQQPAHPARPLSSSSNPPASQPAQTQPSPTQAFAPTAPLPAKLARQHLHQNAPPVKFLSICTMALVMIHVRSSRLFLMMCWGSVRIVAKSVSLVKDGLIIVYPVIPAIF